MIGMDAYEFPAGKTIPAAGATYSKIADVPVSQFLGLALPVDTPSVILEKVTAAFEKVMASPAVKDYVAARHLTLMGLHGEAAVAKNKNKNKNKKAESRKQKAESRKQNKSGRGNSRNSGLR